MNSAMINSLPRFHVLTVTILPATATRAIRVKITSELWKQSVPVPFNNTEGSGIPKIETAINWCEENGFPVIGWENGNTHGYIVTSRNEPLHL